MSAPKDGKKPAKDTRFKPGQSGNPKGRPPKQPRAEVPHQLGLDVRAMGRLTIDMPTPNGPVRMTMFEAAIYRIWMDAARGRISQQRLIIHLLERAYAENMRSDPTLMVINSADWNQPAGITEKELMGAFKHHAKRSRMSAYERYRSLPKSAKTKKKVPFGPPYPFPEGGPESLIDGGMGPRYEWIQKETKKLKPED